jgi:hypothetical protein
VNLRSQLFIWISGLLLAAGTSSYILEIVVTAKELKETQAKLRQKIETLNQKKRLQIEKFIAFGIKENEARINLLLEVIELSCRSI